MGWLGLCVTHTYETSHTGHCLLGQLSGVRHITYNTVEDPRNSQTRETTPCGLLSLVKQTIPSHVPGTEATSKQSVVR